MQYGISLPMLQGVAEGPAASCREIAHQAALPDWRTLEAPQEGCLVALTQRREPHHVGLYVAADQGKILHAQPGVGSVADSIRSLALKGFRLKGWYRYHGIRHTHAESV